MLTRDPPAGLRRRGALAEDGHGVVDHLQEPAGDGEALLLAAVVDAQRSRAEQRHQRRVTVPDAERAVVRWRHRWCEDAVATLDSADHRTLLARSG